MVYSAISESDQGLVGEARAGRGHRVTGVREEGSDPETSIQKVQCSF